MNLKSLFLKPKASEQRAKDPADPRRRGGPMAGGRRAGESANPYLSARRTWNSHVDAVASSRFMAWTFGMLCLLIALVAVAGVIRIGSQSKFIPVLTVVDELGKYLWSGVVDRSAPVPPRALKQSLKDWVCDTRLVTADVALQRRAVFHAYSMVAGNDPATTKLTDWYSKQPPFERAAKEGVSCEVKSAIPQTSDTWQIDWEETVRDRQGALVGTPYRMRVLVTVYVAAVNPDEKPRPDKRAENQPDPTELNPMNIFVRDFSWSKQL